MQRSTWEEALNKPCGPYRHRHRFGRGRPMIPRFISRDYKELIFVPVSPSSANISNTIDIYPDELEALRLMYIEKKSIDEAASIMGISRGTFWRILDNGRRKVVEALVSGRPLRVRIE
ncbi:MAG: DUF134 domain-containing protein [Thermoprotei archaeon]